MCWFQPVWPIRHEARDKAFWEMPTASDRMRWISGIVWRNMLHYLSGLFYWHCMLKTLLFPLMKVGWEHSIGHPSICPGFWAFNGWHIGGMAWNVACWYQVHLQKLFDFGHGLLIFLHFAQFWLVEECQIWGFLAFCWGTLGSNGLKSGMLIYPDHLQKWLDFGHGLLIFLLLVQFWLSEMCQIWGFKAFSSECLEEMAWNVVWCILTSFRNYSILVKVCWFSCFWHNFCLVK